MNPDVEPYDDYDIWKGWQTFFAPSPEEAAYFDRECSGLAIVDADILEIGFGSGSFLGWAMAHDARVAGTEIHPRLLAAAVQAGVRTLPPDFEREAGNYAEQFDTIVAFDVFEHFCYADVVTRLQAASTMLRCGGHLLLRFPNAQSPFGLVPQHGDPTHESALSLGKLEMAIERAGLVVERYGPPAFVGAGFSLRTLVRHARRAIQSGLGAVMNAIFAYHIPWVPVVVLILHKPSSRDGDLRVRVT